MYKPGGGRRGAHHVAADPRAKNARSSAPTRRITTTQRVTYVPGLICYLSPRPLSRRSRATDKTSEDAWASERSKAGSAREKPKARFEPDSFALASSPQPPRAAPRTPARQSRLRPAAICLDVRRSPIRSERNRECARMRRLTLVPRTSLERKNEFPCPYNW